MYDVDDSGSINIMEMTSIISTMDELEGEGGRLGKDSPSARYRILIIISNMDELEGEGGRLGKESPSARYTDQCAIVMASSYQGQCHEKSFQTETVGA